MTYLKKVDPLTPTLPGVDLTAEDITYIKTDLGLLSSDDTVGPPLDVVAMVSGSDVVLTWRDPARVGDPAFTNFTAWLTGASASHSSPALAAGVHTYRFTDVEAGSWTPQVWALSTGSIGKGVGSEVTVGTVAAGTYELTQISSEIVITPTPAQVAAGRAMVRIITATGATLSSALVFDSRDLVNPIADFWFSGGEIPVPSGGGQWVIKPKGSQPFRFEFAIEDVAIESDLILLSHVVVLGVAAPGGVLAVAQLGQASDGSAPATTTWFRSTDGGTTFPELVSDGGLSLQLTTADAGKVIRFMAFYANGLIDFMDIAID